MKFTILKVILWPRKLNLEPRVVSFEPGVVNVITGASQTGKSALIPIVDYCLGSGRCAIPVTTIRDATAWFGVVLDTLKGQVLVARREPGAQQSTDEMYMAEAEQISVPKAINSNNTNRQFVKHYFDELAGLTSLDFSVGGSGTYRSRPSFRDLAAFNFQPQNIIANPDVLFFKADTVDHREKLKNVFPYVLGVTTAEVMAKRFELDELRREQRRAQRELANLRETADRWVTELRINISRAREFGLISAETSDELSQQQAISTLRSVVTKATDSRQTNPDEPRTPSVQRIGEEIIHLRAQEQDRAVNLSQLRQRWLEMSRLREAAQAYAKALQTEEERLSISRWLLEESAEKKKPCPICGNDFDAGHSHLTQLVAGLEEVEKSSTSFRTLPPTFDREFARVRSGIRAATVELQDTQRRIVALQEISAEDRRRRYTELNTSRFIGRLEADLAQYDRFVTDVELNTKLEKLTAEIAELSAEVDEDALRERLKRALLRLTTLTAEMLPGLGVENPQDPTTLSLSELTLKISRNEREDFLWQIGSGSNWLGYHLAIILGLHKLFRALEANPVPSFLMIDQPSQVYFPKKLAGKQMEDPDPLLADEDVDRVRAVFSRLAIETLSAKGLLQVIVVDHAGEAVWGDISGIHLVEEWRNGEKLIPGSWLNQST